MLECHVFKYFTVNKERYDELKAALQNLIDMPDRRLDQIIMFLPQNRGTFPNRRKTALGRSRKKSSKKWRRSMQIFSQITGSATIGCKIILHPYLTKLGPQNEKF